MIKRPLSRLVEIFIPSDEEYLQFPLMTDGNKEVLICPDGYKAAHNLLLKHGSLQSLPKPMRRESSPLMTLVNVEMEKPMSVSPNGTCRKSGREMDDKSRGGGLE